MAFQGSPYVNVREIDLTGGVPVVATTEGAIAGVFRWGPVGERVLISSEQELAARFGKPTNFNSETWFTAANFLAYGNKLYLARGANTTSNSNMVLSIPAAATKFPTVGMTVFQRASDGSTNTGIGVVVSSNSTALVVNTASLQGTFTVYSGSNTSFMVTSGGNTEVVTAVTDDTIISRNAGVSTGLVGSINQLVTKNRDDFETKDSNGTYAAADSDTLYIAKYPGAIGNSLKISVCDSAQAYTTTLFLSNGVFTNGVTYDVSTSTTDCQISVGSSSAVFRFGGTSGSVTANTNTAATDVLTKLTVGDILVFGNSTVGEQKINISSIGSLQANASHASFTVGLEQNLIVQSNVVSTSIVRQWEYFDSVERTIGQSTYVSQYGNTSANDQIHVVVVDDDGSFTNVPGTILEVYDSLSRATDAKTEDGGVQYYKEVINQNSQYVWMINDRAGAVSANSTNIASSTNTRPFSGSFILGTDGQGESSVSFNVIATAYDLFQSPEDLDVSLILQGKAVGMSNGAQLANYIINNICEQRKDCIVFVSPPKEDVVSNIGNELTDVINFRNSVVSSSYAVIDSGYKYQYDRYNDVYRYIPLNGDIAGLTVRTDDQRDPWFSPAGYNRGQIKNIIKLAYNPKKPQRDILYNAGVNPVATFPGEGVLLIGDKTALTKPSAFNRINVRRLFIVLEKAIATAAKYQLFEQNDEFTRAAFKNQVEPYLRDIQGRRGIIDFRVVCDDTNNTGEVIDQNGFVGDIYIKPTRSINYIQLNFVAVRTGVEFSEIVGSV